MTVYSASVYLGHEWSLRAERQNLKIGAAPKSRTKTLWESATSSGQDDGSGVILVAWCKTREDARDESGNARISQPLIRCYKILDSSIAMSRSDLVLNSRSSSA